MKQFLISIVLLCLVAFNCIAQSQFTPYDELPGIDKACKPAFSSHYSGWKKMLYQYPIDFNRIEKGFNTDLQQNPNQKTAIIRYYKIWSRVIREYVNSDGEIVIPDLTAITKKQLNTQKTANLINKSTSINKANWTFLGPKETFWRNEDGINNNELDANDNPKQCPWQANVYSFDVSKTDNNILYCGTETGFVNKSTDKGLTWFVVGLNYPFGGGVPAIAINPNNPDTVYVSAGKQLHKSCDGGETWTPLLSINDKFEAVRIKINPINTNILIAASGSGFYKSTDAGKTWIRKWSKAVWDVEFKPNNPNEVYAISNNNSGNYQILLSHNGGESFATDTNFPTNIIEQSGGLLAVTTANPDILYATLLAKENDGDAAYIFKGNKNGNNFNWTQTKKGNYRPPNTHGGGEFNICQGYFDLVMEASPTNEDILFWGTCSFWKSTDGGKNFNKLGGYGGDFPVHPDIQDLKVLENGETWLATDGGMNYSSDLFSSIQNYSSRTKGIIGSDMWGFDQGWNEDIIVGGRYHNGNTAISELYGNKALRMGGAESATGWVIKGKSRHVAFNDLGNGWILPKTAEDKAEGRFIFSKFPNMEEYGGRRSNMVHHPNYFGNIYVGEGNSIWKSTDSGESFDLLFQFEDKVRYFQISHKTPNVLYADVVNKGLYRSHDGGKSWEHKPALTNGSAGNSYWNGKLFFVLSPNDENKIYACLQNGTWSDDIGKIYRSNDGGNSWENWTSGVDEYTKCMVIQPTKNEQDLLYLFTQAKNGFISKVYSRYESQPYWIEYNTNYPAGHTVNLALPFFRDSKIRVAGNAGVWESPMAEPDFVPVINPWVEKQSYDCMEDTLYFNDHSILNHSGATWEWEITPEPEFISSKNIRDPKIVLGNEGSYDVTMRVSQNNVVYEKTISGMVSTTTCPSVNDCDNPADVDKSIWSLLYVDSEEKFGENGSATNAFDGDASTIWHSEWYNQSPGQPHEIHIDLGKEYVVSKVKYLPRQNSANGRIKKYEIYISNNKTSWGDPVASGDFTNDAGRKTIEVTPTSGQYFKLKSLSEQNNNKFTSIAELDVTGCLQKDITSVENINFSEIDAYPIPTKNKLTVSFPGLSTTKNVHYSFYSITSSLVKSGSFIKTENTHSFNISDFKTGTYLLVLTSDNGKKYRIKLIKN